VESRALGLRLALRLGDDGKNLFGAARALCGESARHPAALRALLEIAAATGKTRETADALGELALRSALQGDDLYVLAQWHAAEGDFARAEVHADNLLESMPEHEPGRHLRAELLLHQGRFVAAAAAFESIARRLEGSLTESPLGPANRAMPCPRPPDLPEQVSSNAPAPAEVRQIRQVQLPSSTRRLLRSTYLAWASAQYELEPKSALPILDRLDSLAAGEPGTAVLRARVELSEGRPEEALHRLAGSSADAGVLAARGDALVALGHVHSARASYLRALRSQPAFAGALVGLGEIELRRAHPLTARSFLRQAEEAFGNSRAEQRLYARLMTALGAAYLQSPDASYLTAATTALHAATELPGAPPEAFYWLGTALHRAGAAGHRAALTHFLELAPDSPSSASAQRLLDAPSAAE
jgi:tetratricopeptide (TPR) repeat protein